MRYILIQIFLLFFILFYQRHFPVILFHRVLPVFSYLAPNSNSFVDCDAKHRMLAMWCQVDDTPVHAAARSGHSASLELLVRAGADVSSVNKVASFSTLKLVFS